MFDTVVLLAETQEQIALAPILTKHNPTLTIKPVATLEQVQSLDRTLLKQARLIAFTTTTVVPANILHAIGYGAHNFHPGPPSYPGWAPAHFAIYEQASHFGATLHLMTERVDSGPILDYLRFPIPAVAAVLELEERAYCELLRLFLAWAGPISTEPSLLESRRATDWSARRNTHRTYQAARSVSLGRERERTQPSHTSLWRQSLWHGAHDYPARRRI
jgi:methionyl-tRNA formyltransferase